MFRNEIRTHRVHETWSVISPCTNQFTFEARLFCWMNRPKCFAPSKGLVDSTGLVRHHHIVCSNPTIIDTKTITSNSCAIEWSLEHNFRIVGRAIAPIRYNNISEWFLVPISGDTVGKLIINHDQASCLCRPHPDVDAVAYIESHHDGEIDESPLGCIITFTHCYLYLKLLLSIKFFKEF